MWSIETNSPMKGCHVGMSRRPDFRLSMMCSLAEQNIYLYSFIIFCSVIEIGSSFVRRQHPVIVKSVSMTGCFSKDLFKLVSRLCHILYLGLRFKKKNNTIPITRHIFTLFYICKLYFRTVI